MPFTSIARSPENGRRRLRAGRQWLLLALVLAGLVIVGLVAQGLRLLFAPAPAASETLPPDTVRPTAQQLSEMTVSPAVPADGATILRASGAIALDGDRSAPILLPYSGEVTRVLVEPGQRVVRGQPLLVVASPEIVDAASAAASAAAQVASARQAAELAARNAARQKAIHDSAGGALKDYQQSVADAAAAQGALAAAQSALRAARGHLALYGRSAAPAGVGAIVYRAPMAGIVTDRAVSPGQFVAAGNTAPLMTIADIARVWLVAQLSEGDAPLVKVGDAVSVSVPAFPGREFRARVVSVGTVLDPATHRLPVRAVIDNPGGLLKPQMFASFAIQRPVGGAAGVVVPSSAIIHEGDTARVWVLGADRLIRGRSVAAAGAESGRTRILSGLAPGERVVTSGALFVNEAGLDE